MPLELPFPPSEVALLASAILAGGLVAQAAEPTLPHLVRKDGRHALIVDGAPFLILGGQSHNSSAWPSTLPKVWSALETLHANTLEVPVSWEQFEPKPGKFDTSIVDELLVGARERQLRLVLLWFGTWKNGSAHYLPMWMKRQPELCPRIIGKDGRRVDSPSPHAPALLEADTRAFRALMRHLKEADPQHTVILVQVENEPGAWNAIRDYSPAAQKLFAAPVPVELLKALGQEGRAGGDWTAVFGKDADEFFHAWSVARFIGQVAAAGKAEYPLPLYVNAALRDHPQPAGRRHLRERRADGQRARHLEGGRAGRGPAGARHLHGRQRALPEGAGPLQPTGQRALRAGDEPGSGRVPLFLRGARSRRHRLVPFGVDSLFPSANATGAVPASDPAGEPFAANYRVIGPMMREIAQMGFEGRLRAAVEEKDSHQQVIALGRWQAVVTFGPPTYGYGRSPQGNPEPVGRVLVAPLGENEFLVTGYLCRVDFKVTDAASFAQREFLRVEEGRYEGGVFRPERIWNGDETDWALNFGSSAQVLRVQLGTY